MFLIHLLLFWGARKVDFPVFGAPCNVFPVDFLLFGVTASIVNRPGLRVAGPGDPAATYLVYILYILVAL